MNSTLPISRILAVAALIVVLLSFVIDGPLVAIAVVLLALALLIP